jgi:hypothetical protein
MLISKPRPTHFSLHCSVQPYYNCATLVQVWMTVKRTPPLAQSRQKGNLGAVGEYTANILRLLR